MTKKEWRNLKIADKVAYKTWKLIDGKPVDIIIIGTVIMPNSNWAQMYIRFDDGSEFWCGRTQIELLKTTT